MAGFCVELRMQSEDLEGREIHLSGLSQNDNWFVAALELKVELSSTRLEQRSRTT
jgi:hypothetical protein